MSNLFQDDMADELGLQGARSFSIETRDLLPPSEEDSVELYEENKAELDELLGKDKALNFVIKHQLCLKNQIKALRILGTDNVETAKEFMLDAQIEALEVLGKESAENALEFDESSLKALQILGKEKVETALKFGGFVKDVPLEVLEFLGPDYAEVASTFDFMQRSELETLKTLGVETAQKTARIACGSNRQREFDSSFKSKFDYDFKAEETVESIKDVCSGKVSEGWDAHLA